MMSRHGLSCLVLGFAAVLILPSPGQAQDKVVTASYDVQDLVRKKACWWMPGEKKVTVDGIDRITRLIVKEVDPKGWRDQRFSIHELNNAVLEIRTTEANHKVIVTFLEALRRSNDVTVVVEAGLYEVDRAFYEKKLAPEFTKNRFCPLALDAEEEKTLRKAARPVRSNKMTLNRDARGQVFSFRRAIPYEWLPRLGTNKTNDVAYVGVGLEAEVHVSSDHRFVKLQLTQSSAELVEMRKQKVKALQGAAVEEVELEVPHVRESSTTSSITVGDGVLVIMPLAVPLPGFNAKDRVPLLFLRPNVLIGEEERIKGM